MVERAAPLTHRIDTYVVMHVGDEDEWPVAAFDDVLDAEKWAEREIGPRTSGSGSREDPIREHWRVLFLSA